MYSHWPWGPLALEALQVPACLGIPCDRAFLEVHAHPVKRRLLGWWQNIINIDCTEGGRNHNAYGVNYSLRQRGEPVLRSRLHTLILREFRLLEMTKVLITFEIRRNKSETEETASKLCQDQNLIFLSFVIIKLYIDTKNTFYEKQSWMLTVATVTSILLQEYSCVFWDFNVVKRCRRRCRKIDDQIQGFIKVPKIINKYITADQKWGRELSLQTS